jgi:GMP synthase-like glutamine amidotransferase
VRVLSIVHQRDAGPGVFADEMEARGIAFDTWHSPEDSAPPAPLSAYDAVMTFGGGMNAHEEEHLPWLRDQKKTLRTLLDADVPILGVCLGSQLLAEAAGSPAQPASRPEIGWQGFELTDEGRADPVIGALGERPCAFQWHSYESPLPPGAVALARSEVCLQAYRIGDRVWGIQFHAEVSKAAAIKWADEYEVDPDAIAMGLQPDRLNAETRQRIGRWNELGRALCGAFLEAAAARG